MKIRDQNCVTEASSLKTKNFLSRVFGDACDEGFIFVSHKTGKKIIMTLSEETANHDAEVVAWKFKPYGSNLKFTAIIFND